MKQLGAKQFHDFFDAIHGYAPFPWQSMLLDRVAAAGEEAGWPDLIDLPTASGKTACIDVAVFALAMGVKTPRRVWFVVDRRIVVDEAFRRATKLAAVLKFAALDEKDKEQRSAMRRDPETDKALADVHDLDAPILSDVARQLLKIGGSEKTPLAVGRLRGGVPRSVAWAGNPAQPAVLTSTIDQIGSRLLFRGYSVSPHAWPVHAALVGNDSLVIVDEAHLAEPFITTVQAVKRFQTPPWAEPPAGVPLKLVVMSATPPAGAELPTKFPSADDRRAALDHRMLHHRMAARKPTVLAVAAKPKAGKSRRDIGPAVCDDELVLDTASRALAFVAADRRRVAVMVNRIQTARDIVKQLAASKGNVQVELLTGRLRPVDRDVLVDRLTPLLKSGSDMALERPIVLVTTQCLEVGADFSFDALITECASLDALRQRFGRLARLGDPVHAEGVILIRKSDGRPDDKLDDDKPLDPIYGNALARTWNWLTAGSATSIDMGIDAMGPRIKELTQTGQLSGLLGPTRNAPILLPAYLDLWAQTSPRPAVEPDVSLFLHGVPPSGERPRAEVRVLWRRDLSLAEESKWEGLVMDLPPVSGEMLQVPLKELRAVLMGGDGDTNADADVEGAMEPDEPDVRPAAAIVPFVIWRGRDDCTCQRDVKGVRPGDTIVFAAYEGNPEVPARTFELLLPGAPADKREIDVYEAAYKIKHGVIRRLHSTFAVRGQAPGEIDAEAVIEAMEQAIPLEQRERFFRVPKAEEYGPRDRNSGSSGFYHVTGHPSDEPLDVWQSDDDEDESLHTGKALPLKDHTRQVATAAAALGQLVPGFAAVIAEAAKLHDIGKADPRFQHVLYGRRPGLELLGKSGRPRLSPRRERLLYLESKLPEGFRHELLSMQMAALRASDGRGDRDLLLHLIGSHHGHCRPFARIVEDGDPRAVMCPAAPGGVSITATQRTEAPPHRLDSGVAQRFWRLTRQYGWWGLAYLEAILRCADTHASAFAEQEGER